MIQTAMQMMSNFLHVSTTDPEDARRGRLLNILIMGLLALDVMAAIAILIPSDTPESERLLLLVMDGIMFASVLFIYFINRYGSGTLASWIFVVMMIVIFAVSDTPEEVVLGRSLFLFVVPIIISSVVLKPYSSFIAAAISSAVVLGITLQYDLEINFLTALGFMLVALVSWLSARSLENALHDLEKINRELDQRVADRTRDLEQSLRREQAESGKNQAILESIADGVIFFDADNRVVVANPSLVGLIGYDMSNIEGKTLEQLMDDKVSDEDQEQLRDYRESSDRKKASIPVAWGNKTLSISFAPVVTSTGDQIGGVMVCRDFTREAELDRMKDRFLSMTSHELRTPLNAILGYTDMMHAQVFGQLTDKQDETVGRITANAKRMLGLVNNILDQAHIDAGTISIRPVEFEVRNLVDDIDSIIGVLAQHRGLTLDTDIAADVPNTLISDEQRLSQILLNLVGNAVKFTKEGGVTLRAYKPDDHHVSFDVQDTGVGIPTDAQQSIFEAFWQVDDPRTREIGGSGLGLSIVKQLVNLLQGTITLNSEIDKGTTFTVTIPLAIEFEQQTKEMAV